MVLILEIRDQGLLESFGKQVDHVGMRKKLIAIAAIGENQMSDKERERLFVNVALSYLPARARTILFLKFWHDHTFYEISDIIGLPMRLVRILFFLSLTYLERELRPYVVESKIFIGGVSQG